MPLRAARKSATLCQSLNRDLTKYALAASAAGVGALALAQPAAAEVIYTPAQQSIRSKHAFAIDLNHDGKTDFAIENVFQESHGGYFYFHWRLQIQPVAVGGIEIGRFLGYGAALKTGASIGPYDRWRPNLDVIEGAGIEFGYNFSYGYWGHGTTAYAGLRFQIDGEDHYGWARLSVEWTGKELLARITGYAYESEPDTPIIAGDTGGADAKSKVSHSTSGIFVTSPPEAVSGTLGELSLGVGGMASRSRP